MRTTESDILAREGWLTLVVALLLTITGWTLSPFLGILATIWLGFCLNFFRNPPRNFSPQNNGILCPADGKIIVITETLEPEFTHKHLRKISIFMSPVNVHVNRAPVDGEIKNVIHHKGKFLAAFAEDASLHNERCATHVVTSSGTEVIFVQVAGWLARRIINYLKPGDNTSQGKIFGLIKFGSRMDIYFPIEYTVRVAMGDTVKAGQTWLATKT